MVHLYSASILFIDKLNPLKRKLLKGDLNKIKNHNN